MELQILARITNEFTTMILPDLKLEDIKTEVNVMTVTITGKIAGIEDADISKVRLELYWEVNKTPYQYEGGQVSQNGEFSFAMDVRCREESLSHNCEYRRNLRVLYDSYAVDEQLVSIHTYIPKGSVLGIFIHKQFCSCKVYNYLAVSSSI